MDAPALQLVRSFNRTVAERIGALEERFLGLARPMVEARILWEIGPQGAEVRALRARLGLDSGYLSRVLRSLERQGLVVVGTSSDDRRVRGARLTEAGLAERAELDLRSDAVATGMLQQRSTGQRTKLLEAMDVVERLLRATLIGLAIENPATNDARWCIQQYCAELNTRFEAGFDASLSISAGAQELIPPAGAFLIARLRTRPVGCAAIKLHAGAPAEVKRMWVAPEARGRGLGRRLLGELERYARDNGVEVLHLETNRTLGEAIQLYRSSGYREVAAFNDEPYAHLWFEKRLG